MRPVFFHPSRAEQLSISNGAAEHFQISRTAREPDFQAVFGTPGRLALDDRKGGNHARGGDDHLLRLSYAGIVLSFPLLLYFLAEFVLPALTTVEKRFLLPAICVSFALFLLGVLVCYFWLLPKTILFFFRDTQSLGWTPTWTVQQYYSFVTRFTIGFGLAFELPVVVLALVRFGLVTYRFMARTRPYAIVLIFILATIITPTPDILTLIAMGLPMCLLYESCIWIAWIMERRRSRSIAG